MKLSRVLTAALLGLSVACAKVEDLNPQAPTVSTSSTTQDVSSAGFPETFETGTKTAYTTGSVTLGSGS